MSDYSRVKLREMNPVSRTQMRDTNPSPDLARDGYRIVNRPRASDPSYGQRAVLEPIAEPVFDGPRLNHLDDR